MDQPPGYQSNASAAVRYSYNSVASNQRSTSYFASSGLPKAVAIATGKAVANLVHASGKRDEAEYEIDLWFDKTELFDYRSAADAFGW